MDSVSSRPKVAVVGAGISGLTAAHTLRDTHDVTLYECEARLGGHAHTHDVPTRAGTAAVDSGFIVMNDRTYPQVSRLFEELGVTVRPTEMSMSISCAGCGLAYVGGRGAGGLFAQRRRLLDPRHWRLLWEIRRFQRAASDHARDNPESLESYGSFLDRRGFSDRLVSHFALPVVSCVWSSGTDDALDYPAAYLFRFLANHGFLNIGGAPQWYVVEGGSREYVRRIAAALPDVRAAHRVLSVARKDDGVVITDERGDQRRFDQVVLATHADEALRLLADPTDDEFAVLGAFAYSSNLTQLHRDESVLPARLSERASWNLRLSECGTRSNLVQVSYWMNRLQGHPESDPLVVTLNDPAGVDPAAVIASMRYSHPIYTPDSVAAQGRLPDLNTSRTAYAGAYHGWGFHEDGCRSGLAAAEHLRGAATC